MAEARLFLAGIAALLAGGLAASRAPAQVASGYSGSSTTGAMDDGEAWRTLVIFGRCYAERHEADAFSLLATEHDSREERATYRRLFRLETQVCLGEGTGLTVPIGMVRGVIAEGLYRRGAPVPANLVQPELAPGTPARTLSGIARCYAAAHRAEVRALLETPVGSRREQEALDAMAPDLFQCVPEFARSRPFDSLMLRFRLAEALLRLPAAMAGAR